MHKNPQKFKNTRIRFRKAILKLFEIVTPCREIHFVRFLKILNSSLCLGSRFVIKSPKTVLVELSNVQSVTGFRNGREMIYP